MSVEVDGLKTTKHYEGGAVGVLIHTSPEAAQAYADAENGAPAPKATKSKPAKQGD
jgi:hypothetical protein